MDTALGVAAVASRAALDFDDQGLSGRKTLGDSGIQVGHDDDDSSRRRPVELRGLGGGHEQARKAVD